MDAYSILDITTANLNAGQSFKQALTSAFYANASVESLKSYSRIYAILRQKLERLGYPEPRYIAFDKYEGDPIALLAEVRVDIAFWS